MADLARILIPFSPTPAARDPTHGAAKSGLSLTRNQSSFASFGTALRLVG